MNQCNLVSVITPTYNHEKYIRSCIESVLNQTFERWEQIIIDDGSTDATADIVKEYKDKRIRYIYQKNSGIMNLSATYNRGLSIARGNLIAILEGDDLWPPNKLELQTPVFQDMDIVLSWGRSGVINEKGDVVRRDNGLPTGLRKPSHDILSNNPTGAILKLLFNDGFITSATVMIRKDALLSIGGFKQPAYAPYVDYPTWLNLALEGRFYWCNDTVGYWRQHGTQYTANHHLEMAKTNSRLTFDFCNSLSEEKRCSIGIKLDNIAPINQKHEACALFMRGRRYLLSSERQRAKDDFVAAFRWGSPYVKIAAAVCLVSCYAHIDPEKLISIFKSVSP